jgi:FtsH-binding integral membrane protein
MRCQDPCGRVATDRATIGAMLAAMRSMPGGLRLFLVYAGLILTAIALSLRVVIDQAIAAPISPLGILVMVLLAYTIFTTTLVLQRKEASRTLALGLASLTIPGVLLLLISPVHPATPFFVAAIGVLLFRGLLRPEVRTYLNEP